MASIRPHLTRSSVRGLGHILSAPFASVAASIASARKRSRLPAGALWLSGACLLGGLAVGIFISTQALARMSTLPPSPLTRPSDRGIVAATIARLESDQSSLKKQIADSRAELSSVQNSDAARKDSVEDLSNEIAVQRVEAGMVGVRGPGVVATFDDST